MLFFTFKKGKGQCLLKERFCENSTGTIVFHKMEIATEMLVVILG